MGAKPDEDWDLGIVKVPYWEFHYRRVNLNDSGRMYVVFDEEDIPPSVKPWATKGYLPVPVGAYYTKGFDITGFFQFWDKANRRHYRGS